MSTKAPTPEQLAGVIRGLDHAFQYCDSTQAFDSARNIREAAAAISLLKNANEALLSRLCACPHCGKPLDYDVPE